MTLVMMMVSFGGKREISLSSPLSLARSLSVSVCQFGLCFYPSVFFPFFFFFFVLFSFFDFG
jgi:hypothetical protein